MRNLVKKKNSIRRDRKRQTSRPELDCNFYLEGDPDRERREQIYVLLDSLLRKGGTKKKTEKKEDRVSRSRHGGKGRTHVSNSRISPKRHH